MSTGHAQKLISNSTSEVGLVTRKAVVIEKRLVCNLMNVRIEATYQFILAPFLEMIWSLDLDFYIHTRNKTAMLSTHDQDFFAVYFLLMEIPHIAITSPRITVSINPKELSKASCRTRPRSI